MRALIVVDIQNDFLAGGNLAVPGGEEIIPLVNALTRRFELVVATQDWHPAGHKSFASSHTGKKPFDLITLGEMQQVLWPDHCVQGSRGAEFHPSLHMAHMEAIFRKGMDPQIDSYSGFYDNGHKKSTGLAGYLTERRVREVYVCGLAGDYCVFYTAKDAIASGFETFVVEDATRAISTENFGHAKEAVLSSGGRIVVSHDITE